MANHRDSGAPVLVSELNVRDRLLLSQILEAEGLDNYAKIHERFVNHPVFKLSHNKLEGTELQPTEDQVEQLVHDLLAEHEDMKIVSICEHYYNLRIEELLTEIRDTKTEFDSAKHSLAT